MLRRCRRALAVAACVLVALSAAAKPFVPIDDATVLERLPERSDPALAQLKRERLALARNPADVALAATVARRAIEATRASGDPRFLGQAQAALSPWWPVTDAPPAILVLRATVKQSTHDFDGALADLDRIVAAAPDDAQARLTRATVLTVQARYADALRDCARLEDLVPALVRAACTAAPASLSGSATDAYERLAASLGRGAGVAPALQAWGHTLAAEIAARRGDAVAAERHFRAALLIDRRDAYLLGAYADFLLDRRRAADVLPLLRGETRNDMLLLRLVLAEAALAGPPAEFEAHRAELAARVDASRRRGDVVHRREEARYVLAVEHDARRALVLARQNWALQREPADLRILAAAAKAAGDAAALREVAAWIAAHRLEDHVLAALVGASP